LPASYLKIAGELVQDALLASVEVTQELNDHWRCAVECRQTADRRYPLEDRLGQDLQIVTYDEQQTEYVIFDGFVLRGKLIYEVFGSYGIVLTAVTRSYKLDLTPQEAYFRKKQLKDVAATLTGADNLSADVTCAQKPARNYVQWGETDFAFLKRIAYEHLAWIRPTAQGIQICDSFQSGAVVEWRAEGGLTSFKVRGRLGQPSFNGTHYDARHMQSQTFQKITKAPDFFGASGPMVAAVQRASNAKLPAGFVHLDSRAATGDEYQQILTRESVRSIGANITAVGISQSEAVKAGDTVQIDGPLDAAGKYGVTKVVHRWTSSGYENEFRCTPWQSYICPEPPQPRHMPGIVPARVVDHNDPRKMGRIKVQYDWLEDGETAWVRMVTPYAGADRGFMFMPEKGDEVLVAFEHGDAERPYAVGCLWNGVDQAPREDFWGGDIDPNDVKRLVTKSGHRIQLSDKQGKEAITIATPSHLKVGMLEKTDETTRSMLVVHSDDGDIFLSAPNGRIHFQSQYLSRETGVSGGSAQPAKASGASSAPAPGPDYAAQAASLRQAAASGTPLCASCQK
jgi:type VI secretion system secreted protein VgrG